ncbi:MAG: anthranilate synthase component II [Candidatus Bathyarchaeia archaeon]
MRVLFINNKDSFVYILVDYVAQKKCEVIVADNTVSIADVEKLQPDRIIVSPGPGHPKTSTGNVIPLIQKFHETPIFGVCLGHQAVVEAFGGTVTHAAVGPRHGVLSVIRHDGKSVFRGVPNPFKATRYHSLAAEPSSLPKELEVSAKAEDGTIMGVRHRILPVEGVQFHPESVLTKVGKKILGNFLQQRK